MPRAAPTPSDDLHANQCGVGWQNPLTTCYQAKGTRPRTLTRVHILYPRRPCFIMPAPLPHTSTAVRMLIEQASLCIVRDGARELEKVATCTSKTKFRIRLFQHGRKGMQRNQLHYTGYFLLENTKCAGPPGNRRKPRRVVTNY